MISEEQKQILSQYDKVKPSDWLKNPTEWEPAQWHFWGCLFTDMSIGYGELFRSFGKGLSAFFAKQEPYIVCGNKDDVITLFLYLCKNNILPFGNDKYKVFRVLGNREFTEVQNINLEDCNFDGTNDTEVHFKIFCSISQDFLDNLKKSKLLIDNAPEKDSFFKILGKHIPEEITRNLNEEKRSALLAGMIDGDGTAGALVVCPECKKRNTIRSSKMNCEKCNHDLSGLIRSMDYNIMLDSADKDRLENELRFLVNEAKLKGHLYVLYVQKEAPDKLTKERFLERKNLIEKRILFYQELTSDLKVPIVIKRHILKSNLPSYHFAPDVYGSIKYLFTPHFKKIEEKIKWYGTKDINEHNLKIIKKALPYIFINKKRAILSQVIKNRNI